MDKVIPLLKPFNYTFYLKIFKHGKLCFELLQIWTSLKI
jgi:hypothetical protein